MINRHEAEIKLLLSTGKVDVNAKGYFGWPPLSWAAERGYEAVVKLLEAPPPFVERPAS